MASSGFRADQILSTSSYQYNCGLNTGVNFLVSRLTTASDAELEANSLFAWQKDFIEYYGLPEDTVLSQIKSILLEYKNAQDLQVILGPVLRLHLKHLIQNNEAIREKLFYAYGTGFLPVMKQFLKQNGRSSDILYSICPSAFNQAIQAYRKYCEARSLLINSLASVHAFLQHDNTENDVLKSWWLAVDAPIAYANYLGQPGNHFAVSEIVILYNQLGISIECCDSYRDGNETFFLEPEKFAAENSVATLKIVNRNGEHWELVADTVDEARKFNDNFYRESVFNDALIATYNQVIIPYYDLGDGVQKHVREMAEFVKNRKVEPAVDETQAGEAETIPVTKAVDTSSSSQAAIKLQGIKSCDLKSLLTYIKNCKDNEALISLHENLLAPKFSYLRDLSRANISLWRGTVDKGGTIASTSHTWANIEKAISLQISHNIKEIGGFTKKVASDQATQYAEQHKFFAIKRYNDWFSTTTSASFDAFSKADTEELERRYTQVFGKY